MKILIRPKLVYYKGTFQENISVLIEDGTIVQIGDVLDIRLKHTPEQELIWENMVMLPGTVNVHNHSFQSLLRGLAVGKPFLEWRDKALYRISPLLSPEDIYIGALLAFGEMMKYGVTCVSDFFYLHNNGLEGDMAIIQAAKDIGIRLVLARTMYDWTGAPKGYIETVPEAVMNTRYLAKQYNNTADAMTTILPAPHSLHAATPEMIQAGHALAQELGTKFHIHVAEEPFEVKEVLDKYQLRPVEYFEKLGVLDDKMVMVHAVWLNDREKELMAANRASLAYCPSSNMFLADGVTDIAWMTEAGINIGLGSDGACSNNRISVFEEMRMASLLQKVTKLNALLIDSEQAYNMGTVNGGTLLDLPIGEIKEGYKADLLGVDLTDISLQPYFPDYEQLLPNIVYSMQPTAIKEVIVNGHQTVHKGKLSTMEEGDIVKQVSALSKTIYTSVRSFY